eukprot:CAMPEP_0185609326 /NCGR_PEP_ID=MMETSP0436-20130131/9682_1 /TAXON_ID=626734 ORGANISM="Favella taraikaensis, Strain Fe Narragansett Bay" /NCGR_SAMPLE_ID=MMETSP0436 /ASSEMBLY_ACC=CAM_ASM_000390 /LENGTH=105 /DNA_ID=CAMNT_0028241707 /DNA_START=1054 /DNA_END=1371 /DNA_ORIENTATION=-
MALADEVLNELHRHVGLVGGDHVARLGHNDRREVLMVPVPAAHIVVARELVIVAVHFARLQVEHLPAIKVDLFDPLEGAAHTVLHVVVSDVNQDCQATGEQLSVD